MTSAERKAYVASLERRRSDALDALDGCKARLSELQGSNERTLQERAQEECILLSRICTYTELINEFDHLLGR